MSVFGAMSLETGTVTGKGKRTLVSGHKNMGVLLQVLRQQVADSVVLLLQGEVGAVGHAWRNVNVDILA